jgi:hypothetical protein
VTADAWSFEYQITLLDGTQQLTEFVGDEAQPFRVTAPLTRGQFYAAAYAGGLINPVNLDWVKLDPRGPEAVANSDQTG